jgi:hypothetical protein
LRFDPRGLDDFLPAGPFSREECGSFGRSVSDRLRVEVAKSTANLGKLEHLRDGREQLVRDGARRFGRRHDREPRRGNKSRNGFRHGRYLGRQRIAPLTAERNSFESAILDMGSRRAEIVEHQVDMTGHEIVQCGRQPAIWHMHDVDSGHRLELLHAKVLHGAYSGGREAELPWIVLGVGNQFLCVRDRKRRTRHQNVGLIGQDRHRHERRRVEWQLGIETLVDHEGRRRRDEQGVSVRLCPRRRLGADVGRTARPVLDNDGVAPTGRQVLRYETRYQVRDSACRNGRDDLDRPARIGLRSRDPCDGRQGGRAQCQMQERAAGKCHGIHPWSGPQSHGPSVAGCFASFAREDS